MRREAIFQTLFRHWLMQHRQEFESAAFELKQTTSDSLPYSAVVEHQESALEASQSATGILYKIPDDSRGIKPFDFVFLRDADAWLVIRFPKFFCVIDYDDFHSCRINSVRKSITSMEAREIAMHTIDI